MTDHNAAHRRTHATFIDSVSFSSSGVSYGERLTKQWINQSAVRPDSEENRLMRYLVHKIALLAVIAPSTAYAASYSKEVRKSCAGDYQNFCSQYAPDTPQLRSCFESNRKGLSKFCINALIDAGEVPAKYLKK